MNKETFVHCKNWGSHCDTAEDWGLLGCDTVSLGSWFWMFQRITLPSSTRLSSQRIIILCELITLENVGIIIQAPNKTLSCPQKTWILHLDTCHFHHVVSLVMIPTFTRTASNMSIALIPPYRAWTEKNWTPVCLNLQITKLWVLCNVLIGNMLNVSDETTEHKMAHFCMILNPLEPEVHVNDTQNSVST